MSRSFTDMGISPVIIPVDFTIRHRPPSVPTKKIENRLTKKEIQYLLSDAELVNRCLEIFARHHKNIMNIYESREDLKSMGYIYFDNFLKVYFSKSKFKNPKCKRELKAKVVVAFDDNASQQATRTMSEFTNHLNNNKSKSGINEVVYIERQIESKNSLDHLNLSVSEIIKKTDPIVLKYLEEFNTTNRSHTNIAQRIHDELISTGNTKYSSAEEVIMEVENVELAIRSLAGRTKQVA